MNRRVSIFLIVLLSVVTFLFINWRTQDNVKPGIVGKHEKYESKGIEKVEETDVVKEESPLIALVLDDFGYTGKNWDKLKDIKETITLAVLPNAPYSKEVCSFAEENNFDVILHLPLQPFVETNSIEQNTIKVGMDNLEVAAIMDNALQSVVSAKAVSNHMGSKATADQQIMELVIDEVRKRNLFFLDSLTSGDSVCGQVAAEYNVPYVKRDIFIDNKPEAEYIREQLAKLEKLSYTNRKAVAIGHDRSLTIKVLNEIIPEMKKRGIKFVSLSELIGKTEDN